VLAHRSGLCRSIQSRQAVQPEGPKIGIDGQADGQFQALNENEAGAVREAKLLVAILVEYGPGARIGKGAIQSSRAPYRWRSCSRPTLNCPLSTLRNGSALASAERTVHPHEFSRLNAQDARRFFDALSKPAELNTKLTEPLLEHERRVDSECAWTPRSPSSRLGETTTGLVSAAASSRWIDTCFCLCKAL
jgi:hypothetical protein